MSTWIKDKQGKWIFILIVFYAVGVVGISFSPWKSLFLKLSSFNLLLTFSILLITRKKHTLNFYFFIFLAFIIGMGSEWLGVHFGWLFGNYAYQNTLGIKLFDVPLIIGVNWGLLAITSAEIAQLLLRKTYLKVILAALLMTVFDYFLEPVAIESQFWQWQGNTIPLFNYFCWLLVSLVLQWLYFSLKNEENNASHRQIYFIMLMFFLILNAI